MIFCHFYKIKDYIIFEYNPFFTNKCILFLTTSLSSLSVTPNHSSFDFKTSTLIFFLILCPMISSKSFSKSFLRTNTILLNPALHHRLNNP